MKLRLGTFNVWGLPRPFADDVSARTRAIARRLPDLDLDVLLIQEAWTDEMRDSLRIAALVAGFEVALASRESGGGLMTISRLPILRNQFQKFQFRGDPERFATGEFLGAKGYQTLILEGRDGPFTVINTHLHARYRRSRPKLNSAVRAAQLLQLVGEIHDLEGTAVIGGDFNCSVDDPEYQIFKGLTGAFEVAEGRKDLSTLSRSNFYKRHRSGPDKRIDYIFLRPAFGMAPQLDGARLLFAEREPIRGIDRSLSDHFGIASQIGWEVARAGVGNAVNASHEFEAFELARGLLAVGREEVDRREDVHLRYAGSWIAGAVLAASLRRTPALNRRQFLRGAASFIAFAALAPAIGYTTLARVDSDSKRDAFDGAQQILAALEATSQRST
ncbi:MAG: endonuclease/exonuclease/phosphatase family protein [Myxococcota bacterium]